MPKKQAVFAFLMEMSIEPTQASSMRMKALRLAPESTTAMHICVLSAMAFLRAASMAFSACSKLTCMVAPRVGFQVVALTAWRVSKRARRRIGGREDAVWTQEVKSQTDCHIWRRMNVPPISYQ